MKKKSIAIDGPAGAGKSTIAKALAERLGFLYVDTGAIYRTVGLYICRQKVDPQNSEAVAARFDEIGIKMAYGDDGLQRMFLNGEDVTTAIREHVISDYASKVSAHQEVRDFLLELQRSFARDYDVIMDGRDIGTLVLPQADLKIFLTAKAEVRAMRRCKDLKLRGQEAEFETVLRDIIERDERDSNRAAAPLRQAEDAYLVDTSELTLEESIKTLLTLAEEKLFHE